MGEQNQSDRRGRGQADQLNYISKTCLYDDGYILCGLGRPGDQHEKE